MNEIFKNRKIRLLVCILREIQNICKKERFRKCDTGTSILNTLKKIHWPRENNIPRAAS